MTDQELETLIDDIESDRVERKESISEGDRFRQAICAFANDLPNHCEPGVLFVGVDDKGIPTGLPVTDQLLLNLSAMRDDGQILPLPSMTVQKRVLRGRDVAVVTVRPADAPPVRYKGTIWIRVGPRRGIANADDERVLNEKRRFKDVSPDIRPLLSAGLDVLDDMLFQRVYLPSAISNEDLERNQRTIEQQLLAVRFAHPGAQLHPTVLGVLTVGRNPTDWIPGDYIQFLRIHGENLTDPIQSAQELRGTLPDLLLSLDELLKVNIQSAVDFTSGSVEIRTPDYPLVAMQQIARNAVMHRSYENTNAPVQIHWFKDRIEIQSPGGPFGRVNNENFGKPGVSDYRNPNLAAVMKDLGFVQRFGAGIAIARQEMARNGNPPPEFQVEASHVAVILRRRQ